MPGAASSTPTSTPAASSARARVLPAASPLLATPAAEPLDLQSWSSRQLAAELVMTGAKMGDVAAINHAAALGIGGVVLFGPASPNLARTLTEARAVAPRDNAPLIASDEEGGQVQRLGSQIYSLPSAELMGHWSAAKVTRTARAYALRMKALGVNDALGPDADLAVSGHYIAAAHRGFS